MHGRLFGIIVIGALAMSTAGAGNYAEGQIWSYKTRPGEPNSTLLINKVEPDPKLGLIYHISVLDVAVTNPRSPSGVTSELPHLPVSEKSLEASCIKLLVQVQPGSAYLNGYTEWKRAFEQRRAGVFTVPVAEIVGIVESAVNK